MTKQIKVECGVRINVRRPGGAYEVVEITTVKSLCASSFRRMQVATKAAGRGEVLAWEQLTRLVDAPEPTAAEIAEQRAYEFRRSVERTSANGHA